MKVRFLENVDISSKVEIYKGEIFEAKEEDDFIMTHMEDDTTVKAPKCEMAGILEIIKKE